MGAELIEVDIRAENRVRTRVLARVRLGIRA